MATATARLSLDTMLWQAGINKAMAALSPLTAAITLAASVGAKAFGGMVDFLGDCVQTANEMEDRLVSMTTLLGGNEQGAHDLVKALQEMANVTPLQMPEITDAARAMLSYGTDAKDVVDTVRMLGDVSTSMRIPLGDLADLYGKNLNQSQLYLQDIRQMQGRGIPIVESLAKVMSAKLGRKVSKSEVATEGGLVTQGQIKAKEMQEAFKMMTSEGGRFFKGMENSAGTWTGLMSTLQDGWTAIKQSIGGPIQSALKPFISVAIDLLKKGTVYAVELGKRIAHAIQFITAAFKTESVGELLWLSLKLAAMKFYNYMMKVFDTMMAFFGGSMVAIANMFVGYLKELVNPDFWKGIGLVIGAAAVGFGGLLLSGIGSFADGLWSLIRQVAAFFSATINTGINMAVSSLPGWAQKQLGMKAGSTDWLTNFDAEMKNGKGGPIQGGIDWIKKSGVDAKKTASMMLDEAAKLDPLGKVHDELKKDFAAASKAAKRVWNGKDAVDTSATSAALAAIAAKIEAAIPKEKALSNKSNLDPKDDGVSAASGAGGGSNADWLQKVGGGGRAGGTINPLVGLAAIQVYEAKKNNVSLTEMIRIMKANPGATYG